MIFCQRTKTLTDLPIDLIQHIALLTDSTTDYLNLALCCKYHLKILQKPKRWRMLKHFTQIVFGNDGYKMWFVNGKLHRGLNSGKN